MKDETYVFISDVKAKGSVARSARNARTHCGKGGRVRLPSDNLSKKELMKMSGECKSYRLNEPMTWKEFMSMPDDIKITYVKLLRNKFGCPDSKIGEMMGANKDKVSRQFIKLGLDKGKTKKKEKWDKEGFWAWANGVDKLPTPVPEEPVEEPVQEEPEVFVEDDLPCEEQDDISTFVPVEHCMELDAENTALKARIDELEKRVVELIGSNKELMGVHEKDKAEIAWLRKEHDSLQNALNMREAQLEIVQLICGGQNRGN